MRLALLTSALLLALSACAQSEPAPSAPPPAALPGPGDKSGPPKGATARPIVPLDQKKFGAAITEQASTPLTTIVKEPTKYASQTVRTEGTVVAVCQSMGCWMEIGDDTGQAHIKMAGHSFMVPRSASGHRAVVQGKVMTSTSNECGGKDSCREQAAAATGQIAKVEIEAAGVEFLD